MYPYSERLLFLNLYPLGIHLLRGDLILTFGLFAENQASSFSTLDGESSLRGHLEVSLSNFDSLTL